MSTLLEQKDQKQPNQHLVETVCKKCIFSVKDPLTNQQFDCSRGRLNKYRKLGVSVRQDVDDDGIGYFTIEGRCCIFCRDQSWLEANLLQDAYSFDVEKQLLEETTIKYDAILIDNGDYRSFKRTIKSLEHQLVLPQRVTVLSEDEVNTKLIVNYFLDNAKYKWNVKIVDGKPIYKVIDDIVANQTSVFYTLSHTGYVYNENLFGELNERIVDNLEQIAVILPDEEGNGLVVSVMLHKGLLGNVGKLLTDKIIELKWNVPTVVNFLC
jgi:hypothetical protein